MRYGVDTRIEFNGFTPDGPAVIVQAGPELWEELHSYQGCDPQWLAGWEARLPCGSCVAKYLAIKERMPPRFDSPESFFAWGVDVHNEVNSELGRSTWALDEAKVRWGR